MIEQRIFSRFPSPSSETLSSLSLTLYKQQKEAWQLFSENVASLKDAQTRLVNCKTFSVRLQFNPKRIVSSSAKVDAASIKARECFLCVSNLPTEQMGVLYKEKFLILCNPMPIFQQHFTVSHINHIPQSIEEHILTLLDISKDFSASHLVFYNGPKCGASAPDHVHFQACPKDFIPVEREAAALEKRKYRKRIGEVNIFTLTEYGRAVAVMESKKKQDLEFCFLRFTAAMRKVMNMNIDYAKASSTIDEPMMNVICSYSDGVWRIIVFPRTKHRPAVYFLEEGNKVLISPAAVDMGGLIVLPVEKDFKNIDAHFVEEVYNEVSVSDVVLNSIVEKM